MFIKMILKLIILLFLLTAGCLTDKIHPMYGVGSRIEGDHLLVTDFLESPTESVTPRNHTIEFQYPLIDKVISYIELSSNSNVYAEFVLRSVDEKNAGGQILKGTVTAIKALKFYLKISVFGYDKNEMPKDFQSILHSEIALAGAMKPQLNDDDENDDDDDDDDIVDDIENDYYDDDYDDENILVIGDRQPGDELLYETFQASDNSENLTDHSVNFYYVDANYITLAKFTTLHTKTAAAIYSHVSEHTLKAVIFDTNIYSLVVKLELYGFRPDNLPNDYYPPLPASDINKMIDKLNKDLNSNITKNETHLNELLSPTQMTITSTNTSECKTNNGIKLKSEIFYLYNIFIGLILIGFYVKI